MSQPETDFLAALLGLRFYASGVGDRTLRRLLPALTMNTSADALSAAVQATPGISRTIRASLEAVLLPHTWQEIVERGQQLVDQAGRLGVQIVVYGSAGYPILLRETNDAPAVLFARGRLDDDARAVACVGTRTPGVFGSTAAERITTELAQHHWTIVSGLAKGIDTIAHRAALAAGTRTVAVLGNGLDSVYPAVNQKLAEEIVANGGLLLSEQPFGTGPGAANLVQRDRLQSGMAVATIVFESTVGGGAMHTASFARKQGRLVACPVPPPRYSDDPSCSGIQQLLADGAYAIAGRADYPALLTELEQRVGNPLRLDNIQ